nr:hypothetical protein [Tanacetum cinerariifolium]
NCPKCGNPVDGQYCQGCALLRKKFKEDLFTYCIENGIFQDAPDPSNDNTNVVNALQEPFVVKQDPGKNSSQSPPQINHHCCYGCGDSLEDIFCHQCTCEFCGKGAHYGCNCPPNVLIIPNPGPFNNQTIDEFLQTVPSFDPTCYSEDGISFTYDSKSNLVDDSPNVFNPPPQTSTYLYEFYGNNAYYGHDYSLQETILEIELTFKDKHCQPKDILKLFRRNHNDVQNIHEELAVYINTPSWDCPTVCYNNDDEKDSTIAIIPKEPDNSLSMGDEHLDTILATKSDEFIKSSVENLVQNPSESKGENECDVPACDDFTTFSNILFDADYDFSSSIEEDDYDSERDILILEELLSNDSLSLLKNESFHFDIPSSPRPPA